MSIGLKAVAAVGGILSAAAGGTNRRRRSPDASRERSDPDSEGDHFECPYCESEHFYDAESWSDHMENTHGAEGPL